jgi:pimeloyl-ACP methyl ester carboxylesterase
MHRPTTERKIHIAFDDIGAGDPAVVLLHGLFGKRTHYAAQAQHLAARHRALSIDLRGHGESDVPDEDYSLDILADDVVRVCDEVGITRAVFCGHSFAVALKVVAQRPDLAAGLVLLDGVVLLPRAVRENQAGFAHVLETDGWREAALGYFAGLAGGAADRVRADITAAPRVYAASIMRDIASSDYAEELAAVHCPFLYVHGRMPLDMDRLRALQPDAIVETIPNVGHWLMLTSPAEVNAVLDRFSRWSFRVPRRAYEDRSHAAEPWCHVRGHDQRAAASPGAHCK